MDRIDFIQKMRAALSGEVNHNIINENIRYYEDYMDMEIKKGKTQEQVLNELGDPRLLAKTIIETSKAAGDSNSEWNQENSRANEYEDQDSEKPHVFKMPGWLSITIIVIVVFLVLALVVSLLWYALPIILVIFVISWIIKFFRN